jgi:hypothetical protein
MKRTRNALCDNDDHLKENIESSTTHSKRMKLEQQQPQQLPNDCLLQIFFYCDAEQMTYTISKVSLTWKLLYMKYESLIWREICCAEWPTLKQIDISTNWKKLYSNRVTIINSSVFNGMCSHNY